MSAPADLPLITTIAAGFTTAFICGMIATRLRLSPIVGYLLAGIVIGPYSPGFVADVQIAEQLAEIGILLLMFGVGLHFSWRDLMAVRHIALPGAIAQIAAAILMGAGMSHFWGWEWKSGLMLGLALSVASTVVLLRALEDHGLLKSTHATIAIGWLIVEDLFVVLAVVLIPAFGQMDAKTLSLPWRELVTASVKVLFFVVFMLVAGRRLLPWLLLSVARLRSRELFTLCVFAVAIGVAFLASELFGVSFALGAFLAGMMINESDLSHEAAEKALPLQDAFAVLFFVSVGMLFNPVILLNAPLHVLAVVLIIVVGKTVAAATIVLLFRYPLSAALLVSAGLAQVGEFSFILANLGVENRLLPEEGRSLILAGAIISISLNPLFFHINGLIYAYVARRPLLSRWFDMRGDDLAHLRSDEKQSLRELVILAGHGRVGRHISANIQSAHIDLVIIDTNRERIESLRAQNLHAIVGDASQPETLIEAAIHQALAIVVAVPNPFDARRIVEAARAVRSDIRVLVRAHNEEEIHYFEQQTVDLVVMGPREVGRRMVEYLDQLRRRTA